MGVDVDEAGEDVGALKVGAAGGEAGEDFREAAVFDAEAAEERTRGGVEGGV